MLNFGTVFKVEIRNIGKNGRVEIWTKTFRNDFVLETSADGIEYFVYPRIFWKLYMS